MSKPSKPWRQCCTSHPANATTVWIRLWPAIGQPVQAIWNQLDDNFVVTVTLPDGSDPISANYRLEDVFAWREL